MLFTKLVSPRLVSPLKIRLLHNGVPVVGRLDSASLDTESDSSFGAVYSRSSINRQDARLRALSLYRTWLRNAEGVVELYYLDIPASKIRQRVRQEFEKNRFVSDPGAIDILLWKGVVDFQETINLWKQKTHMMRFFSDESSTTNGGGAPLPPSFLHKFLN